MAKATVQQAASHIAPRRIPPAVREAWLGRGWSERMLDRAYELRVRQADIDRWLKRGKSASRRIQRDLDRIELLQFGTLRARQATWNDDEQMVALYADSPESVGDREVAVERSPYPFAQFRLQENVSIRVLEQRGVIVASIAHSARDTVVGGQRVSVAIYSAWRTRSDARGHGFGQILRQVAGPALSWRADSEYYYRRRRRKGGLRATVQCYPPTPFSGDASGIRPAQREDLAACVALINRTHRGLDLFRPYTDEFLEQRLDNPCWGPKPWFWTNVYGWEDFHVLEEEGVIVACAGLWDRGRHMREVWRDTQTGATRTIDATGLMDFGLAEDRDDAMARLIEYLVGETERLGRGRLMAPLQFLPELTERLKHLESVRDTRPVYWQPGPEARKLGLKLTKPYTDLAYW